MSRFYGSLCRHTDATKQLAQHSWRADD